MEQNRDNKEIEIDLGKIFYKMRNKVIYIILITVIAALGCGLITQFAVKPQYTATTKMYVYSNTDRISTDSSITATELDASQELVNTYIYILNSDTVLDAVIKDLELDATAGQLRKAINASQAEKTVAFEVKVTTKNPTLSAKIANSIAKIAPSEIVRVVKAGGVEIIDYAKVPSKPSSPNLKKNVFIAIFFAFVLSFAGFFIFEMFDTTITSERDISGDFDIPILGTVPNLEENRSSGYGKKTKSNNRSASLNNAKGEDK